MDNRPNILFFFTDQQRWDTCGCYGQRLEVTPRLDRMAASGVRFSHAFTCQPVCGPARACLQTGRYAAELGCFRNNIALPPDEPTVAGYLREAGYEAGYIGKWHLASGPEPQADYREKAVPPERRGGYEDFWLAADVLEFTSHGYDGHMFDAAGRKVKFTGYRADCCTDFVLEYLTTRDLKRPFFLFASYIEPHHQNDHNRFEGPLGSAERFADYDVPGDLEGTGGDWRENYPDYLGCCRSLDDNLGRVLDTLEEMGIADNTLVLFTTDHGCHFRTRNSEYKRSCHDASLRIPMVLSGPGFTAGATCEAMASLIDIPPTILRAAGLTPPPAMRGRPLQEAVAGANDWPQEVFAQISETQVGRCIRTRRWKYAVSSAGDPVLKLNTAAVDTYTESHLYDLAADPHERENRIADPALAAVRDELRAVLLQRMRRAGEDVPAILPATEVVRQDTGSLQEADNARKEMTENE